MSYLFKKLKQKFKTHPQPCTAVEKAGGRDPGAGGEEIRWGWPGGAEDGAGGGEDKNHRPPGPGGVPGRRPPQPQGDHGASGAPGQSRAQRDDQGSTAARAPPIRQDPEGQRLLETDTLRPVTGEPGSRRTSETKASWCLRRTSSRPGL